MYKRQGILVANDISSSRAKGLLKNMEVFGIGNMLVLSEEPGRLEQYFPEYFDKILIDAPCSGAVSYTHLDVYKRQLMDIWT